MLAGVDYRVLVVGLLIGKPPHGKGSVPVSIDYDQKVFFCSLNPGVLGRMSTRGRPQHLRLARPLGKNSLGLRLIQGLSLPQFPMRWCILPVLAFFGQALVSMQF